MTSAKINNADKPPVLGLVAYSGSGKTTLLTKLIPLLSKRGLRIAVIKHAHHQFDIDTPGKDSYELRKSGARQTLVASKNRWALMTETPNNAKDPSLHELISQLDLTQTDVILVEGFKHESYPKLEVHRTLLNKPLLYPQDSNIIGVISDKLLMDKTPIPNFLNSDLDAIVDFIVTHIRISHEK